MNRTNQVIKYFIVLCLIGTSFLTGCATPTPSILVQNQTEKMKKVIIVLVPIDKEMQVLDHIGLWEEYAKMNNENHYNNTGDLGFVFAAINVSRYKRASVGGDLAPLKDQIKDYPIQEIFEARLVEWISKRYEVLKPGRDIHDIVESGMKPKKRNNRCLEICRQLGADTMIVIEYYYGLAAYRAEKASAAIDGFISVYDVLSSIAKCNTWGNHAILSVYEKAI